MSEILSSAQMRAIERAAIDSGAVTGLELMERAGRGVVEAIFGEWPHLAAAPHKAVVVCGPGNNGGDGFVVARLLKTWGWEVAVFLCGDSEKLPPDARVNCARWASLGPVGQMRDAPRSAQETDLFVDALFGTGLTRPLAGAALQWVAELAADPRAASQTVAVDIPSGLCSDSGRGLGAQTGTTVRAGLTVTFHAAKHGHYLGRGPFICGRLVVKGIGLGHEGRPELTRLCQAPPADRLGKKAGGHKYAHGHALVLSGGAGRTGAARLAADGALRAGAGLVTVAAPGAAMPECACQLTAVMLRRCDDAAGLARLLEDERLNVLCLGPGLGLGEDARALTAQAVQSGRKAVLDADALTLVARDASIRAALHRDCVLTPHGGEFARLFPDIAEKLEAPPVTGPAFSKVDATREAAARAGCVVLFKGPDTVIAAPDGRCAVNAAVYDRAAPWLATAGSGDVLAGMIAGLMARGFDAFDAACAGAWLHVEAARAFGPGLIAEDLAAMLPRVFRDLGL
ncbi:NAD(P)H-hydrate dehydratase [Rhodovulum euryhalinum]|uniref:Bifunctional NAD(P)H-hydrate repair enzyme n=1 Tax=Rhodovulum euryhalinum TaxID=35805 RepID=A0A4R2KBR0_9RHOB|nr:NAD(P)H-hydrate dehydratase [Rhodovulum euryhalinum]TCO70931.1 hydroxyethylthiazole kinase-like uncharacterized protein yjeF/hydroxyethylthiazole kinase-like uncharacterized protein yjeF [Rhodovulum euryhalinum]